MVKISQAKIKFKTRISNIFYKHTEIKKGFYKIKMDLKYLRQHKSKGILYEIKVTLNRFVK